MSCANILAVIEAMADSGASPQAIVAAARKVAKQDEARRAEVREQARIRKQRQRHRERVTPVQPVETKENTSRVTQRDTRACELPKDWKPPEDWLGDARAIAFKAKKHLSDQELENEADKFRDYWTAQAGAKGRKRDWRGTWRNWIRTCLERRPAARNAPGANGPNAYGQHGSSTIADAAIRRHLQRQNGNGVPDDIGRGHDIPAAPDIVDAEYRLVG